MLHIELSGPLDFQGQQFLSSLLESGFENSTFGQDGLSIQGWVGSCFNSMDCFSGRIESRSSLLFRNLFRTEFRLSPQEHTNEGESEISKYKRSNELEQVGLGLSNHYPKEKKNLTLFKYIIFTRRFAVRTAVRVTVFSSTVFRTVKS